MLKRPADEYSGYRDAGVRLNEPVLPSLESHTNENVAATLDAIHAFDKAHLVMLIEEGLVDADAGVAMLQALRDIDQGDGSARAHAGGGKHSGERHMIRTFGQEIGGQLHLGRSSGDLGAVARRLTIRAIALEQVDALLRLRRASLEVGHKYADTIMPASTHLQHGQPTTFGHWATMWNQVFARDVSRTLALVHRVNLSPAGAAIMTGSDFPLNRERTARLLGFEGVLQHTYDAVQSTDDLFEAASVFAITGANLHRLAADLQLMFSTECSFVDVPDRFCGTSSIMMQKRNPSWMGQAKGAGGQALSTLVAALTMGNGPTGVPIEERNMGERLVFSSAALLTSRLREGVDLLRAVEPNAARMLQATNANWACATDLAGALVRERGLDWRSAHQVVGVLVRLCTERDVAPMHVTPELLDEAAQLYMGEPVLLARETITDALDPQACVARRTGVGGPAPATNRAQIRQDHVSIDEDQRALDNVKGSLAVAARELESAIDSILGVAYRSQRPHLVVGQSPGHAHTCCG
jgi:argininosuccinate lyase